jgi:hypothetical protein
MTNKNAAAMTTHAGGPAGFLGFMDPHPPSAAGRTAVPYGDARYVSEPSSPWFATGYCPRCEKSGLNNGVIPMPKKTQRFLLTE